MNKKSLDGLYCHPEDTVWRYIQCDLETWISGLRPVLDAAGQPLRPEDDTDQEEIVEPLGLPEDLRKPSITAKGFRQK